MNATIKIRITPSTFAAGASPGLSAYVDEEPGADGVHRGVLKHSECPVFVRWDGEAWRETAERPCTHCGRETDGYAHVDGAQRGLQRCDPADTGQEYGLNAHTRDTPCAYPCDGLRRL